VGIYDNKYYKTIINWGNFMNIKIVIMAGGKGERFWPKSRLKTPKQLLPITNNKSMLRNTIERVLPLVSKKDIIIVASNDIIVSTYREAKGLVPKNLIFEPMGRNTAACIGLAAIKIISNSPSDTVMVVLSADHQIKKEKKFINILKKSARLALDTGRLITMGITPTRPDTGYGYIKMGRKIKGDFYKVNTFIEKPSFNKAKIFFKNGGYLWNSGMFIWTAQAILEGIKEHMPVLYKGLMSIKKDIDTPREKMAIKKLYKKLESISIDYGVMEKAENIAVVKGNFDWDDVGSWLAMERIFSKDKKGNIKTGDFVSIDTKNCITISDKGIIGAIGLKNIVIIKTQDATLVCPKDRAQDVKKIVKEINKKKEFGKYL
jgi:mannose-1-phosphate guanylyltransferase